MTENERKECLKEIKENMKKIDALQKEIEEKVLRIQEFSKLTKD